MEAQRRYIAQCDDGAPTDLGLYNEASDAIDAAAEATEKVGEVVMGPNDGPQPATDSDAIPDKAREVLDIVTTTGSAPPGYRGGRNFANDGRADGEVLPEVDEDGNSITYKEYDVNPFEQGVNRGPERIVVGSDGRSYYTDDHYDTFTPMG